MKLNPATILTILSILVILVTASKWWIDTKVEKEVADKIGPLVSDVSNIAHEVRTNGGKSIKDQVTTIDSDVKIMKNDIVTLKEHNERAQSDRDSMADKLDRMYEMMLHYLTKNG